MAATNEKMDLRGLSCPAPVIKTKKVFDQGEIQAVEVLVDDDVCVNNLQRLASSLKAVITVVNEGDHFKVTLEKKESESATAPVAQHSHQSADLAATRSAVPATQGTGTVVLLSKDTLGSGDEEFSKTLLNIFLQTTLESGLRPRAILMLNSGVRMMAPGAATLKVLNDFKAAGCEVLACGLCVEYYKLKDAIPKEQVTNMFAICEYLFAADRIVQP